MKIKSELVNDDWERVYVNDKLLLENHSIYLRNFLRSMQEESVLDESLEIEFTEVQEEE